VAIAGTSGSGKSLLLNEIAMSYLGTGARVWIIDVGRSYEKACRNVGGSFIEFTESAGISLNPFSFVEDIDEDMELLQPLLAQMVSPRETLDGFRYSTLGAAIKKVWKAKGRAMTITDIHALLATGRYGPRRLCSFTELEAAVAGLGSADQRQATELLRVLGHESAALPVLG
jgi:conjugal transfer ATP-binding protein TraC